MDNKQFIKGSLNVIILKLLKDQKRMYGYEITQKVKELTNGEIMITEGALYPALHKLESEGLIASELEKVNGRTRKYYLISAEGGEQVPEQLKDFYSFLNNIHLILNTKPSIS